MKRIAFISALVFMAAISWSQEMKIHKTDGNIESIPLSVIDSITFTSAFPTQDLVAYYPFNGNADDESGNGHHGTVFGSTLTTDRFGNAESAYYLNGTSADYIDIADTFFNIGWQEYTISLWFNSESLSQSMQTLINTNPHNGICLSFNYQLDHNITYHVNSDPQNPTWDIFLNQKSSHDNFQINTWYHVVFQKQNNTYRLFINGILDTLQSSAIIPINYDCGIRIGKVTVSSPEYFKGKLDDYRIYNRHLSDAEIQELYHEGGW